MVLKLDRKYILPTPHRSSLLGADVLLSDLVEVDVVLLHWSGQIESLPDVARDVVNVLQLGLEIILHDPIELLLELVKLDLVVHVLLALSVHCFA